MLINDYSFNLLWAIWCLKSKATSVRDFRKWGSAICMSANFDQIIGLKIADTVADRFDYCCSLSLLFTHKVFSFLVLFAKFVEVFCAGQILCWILPDFGYFLHFWGLPLILRFYLTNYISVCWLIDQLFGSAIMKNLQDNLAHSDVGRRFTYRLICIWLVPIASPFYVHQNFLNGSLNNINLQGSS